MVRAGCIRPVAPPGLRCVPTLALALLLEGCATTPRGQRDLLEFVIDGQTSCAQLQERLGPPSSTLEDGGIRTYRIGTDQNGYTIGPPDTHAIPDEPGIWGGLQYSFVVTCDPSGTVARHSLVPVKTRPDEASDAEDQ
jgi:hypothetical protein